MNNFVGKIILFPFRSIEHKHGLTTRTEGSNLQVKEISFSEARKVRQRSTEKEMKKSRKR